MKTESRLHYINGPREDAPIPRPGMDLSKGQVAAGLMQGIPLQQLGTTEEIARCVAFLASNNAAFITGQELVADGTMFQF